MPEQEQIEVTITGDADALAAALSKALEGAMNKSMAGISASLRTLVNQNRAAGMGKTFATGFRNATDEIKKMATELRKVVNLTKTAAGGGGGAGLLGPAVTRTTTDIKEMGQALGHTGDRLDEFVRDFKQIQAPTQEMSRFNHLQEQVQIAFREMTEAQQRFGAASRQSREAQTTLEIALRAAKQQRDLLGQITVTQRTELAKQEEAAHVAAQGVTSAMKAANSAQIVDMQTSAAREVAITKRSAQQRVEIIRAVVGQIRALERGIAAIIRGGVQGFGRLTSAAGRAAGRLGSVFSRSDTQMATGLGRAMGRRETILRSSMSRQERIIQSSVVRQSAQFTRLETASSRGIAGVVSGRSQLGALLGGGLAIGGGFALISQIQKLATAGADFTQGLAVLDAQLGLTDKQLARVRETAIELGNDITLPGVSALDAAQAIQTMTKQFGALGKGAVPAATAAAKGVLQLSRASGASAEAAAQVVGSAINVFGISADKAVDVADQITGALAVAAGTSFDDFALAFRAGATVFNEFQTPVLGAKDSLIEFNTVLAALARGGLTGSVAGDALKQFFLQANRGTADSIENLNKLADRAGVLGTVFFDANEKARPIGEAIQIMQKGLEGLSDQERTRTLQKIFGSDAIRAAGILARTSQKTFDTIRDKIRQQGLAAEIAAAQNQGLRGAMDALNSVVETQAIRVYESLNILLGNIVLTFANFLNQLLSGEGIFATLRTALKGVALGLGSILAVKGVAELFRFLFILARGLLTPMGLLIVVASGLGAAFALMMDNSRQFREAVRDIIPSLKEFGGAVVDFLQARLEDVADFIGGTVIPALQRFGTFLGDVFGGSDIEDQLIQAATGRDPRTVGEKIGDWFRQVFGVIGEIVGNLQELLGDLFFGTDFADAFAEAMTGADTRSKFEQIGGTIRDAIAGVVDTVVGAFNTAREAIGGAISNVQELFGDLLFGTDFADAMAESVAGVDTRSTFEKIGGSIREFLLPAAEAVQEFAKQVGILFKLQPSKGLLAIGGILAGIAGGFAVAGPLGAAIGGLGAAVAGIFATGLGDDLGKVFSGLWEKLRGPLSEVKARILDFLGDFFDPENLKNLAFGFLDLVEEIGRILGSIVSDPRFLTAIAGLAAFAVTVGFRFVVGLGRGIKDNLPELGSLLLDGLKALLDVVFSDPQIFLSAISGIFLGTALIRLFRNAGAQAGQSFLGGLKTVSFGGAFAGGGVAARGGAPGAFVQSLLGRTPGAEVVKVMRGVGTLMSSEMRRMRSTLQTAGRQFTPTTFGISQAFRQLATDVGPSGIAGLQLRAKMKATFDSLRTLSFAPMRNLGVSLIQTMSSIGKGAAGALAAGFAGFQTGQAVAGESTLTQVLGVGGLALALGTVNPLLGVVAGAAGLAGIAFGKMSEDVEDTSDRVNALADSLLGVEDPMQVVSTKILDAFGDLPVAIQDLLVDAGFSVDTFFGQVERGDNVIDDLLGRLKTVDPGSTKLIDNLAEAWREGGITSDQMIKQIAEQSPVLQDLGVDVDALTALWDFYATQSGEAAAGMSQAERNAALLSGGLGGLGENIKGVGDEMASFFAPGAINDTVTPALDTVTTGLLEVANQSTISTTALQEMFGMAISTNLEDSINTLITRIPGLISQVAGLDLSTILGQAERDQALDTYVTGFITEFNRLITDGEITSVPQFKINRGKVIAAFEEQVNAALARGEITPDEAVDLKADFREALILDPDKIHQLIQAAIDAVPTPEVQVNVRGKAAFTIAEGTSATDIQLALTKWFAEQPDRVRQVVLKAEGLPNLTIPRDLPQVDIRSLVDEWLTGQPEPLPVTLRIKGQPRLTLVEGLRPRQVARQVLEKMEAEDIPKITLAVNGKPVLTIKDEDKLTAAQIAAKLKAAMGGRAGGPAGEARGLLGGTGADAVNIPITANPVVTISEGAGGAKAIVTAALAEALADVTLNVPVTINPIVSVAGGGQLSAVFALVGVGLGPASPWGSPPLLTRRARRRRRSRRRRSAGSPGSAPSPSEPI